ncbi:MAG: hypothetical protein ACYSUK_00300 [Planctomycetota bacterium]|jgi:hypothetical protein
MSNQEIFDYLKKNARIHVESEMDEGGGNYGYDRPRVYVTVSLHLRNPATGEEETIAICQG